MSPVDEIAVRRSQLAMSRCNFFSPPLRACGGIGCASAKAQPACSQEDSSLGSSSLTSIKGAYLVPFRPGHCDGDGAPAVSRSPGRCEGPRRSSSEVVGTEIGGQETKVSTTGRRASSRFGNPDNPRMSFAAPISFPGNERMASVSLAWTQRVLIDNDS